MICRIFVVLVVAGLCCGELHEIGSWRLLQFSPPSGFPANTGSQVIFTGIAATSDRLFLSMPRYSPGQPISLGWVPKPQVGSRLPQDQAINPFPDWEWHRSAASGAALNNCTSLISVYRSRVDVCGRLWVLDAGVQHSTDSISRSCPPKLLVFHPSTGQLLRRIEFRGDLLRSNSLFVNLVLDTRATAGQSCDNMFVYIADSSAPAIVVYDVQNDRGWRLTSPQMYPSPQHGIFTVAGESFYLMDGITGMALSSIYQGSIYRPNTGYTERNLYFQPLSSDHIYSVATSDLLSGPKANGSLAITLVGYKPSQGVPLSVDSRDGADKLIFSSVKETWVVSWDPIRNQSNLMAYNPNLLQFVMDLVVDQQQVYAISTRFQLFFNGKVNPNEINLRILRIDRT